MTGPGKEGEGLVEAVFKKILFQLNHGIKEIPADFSPLGRCRLLLMKENGAVIAIEHFSGLPVSWSIRRAGISLTIPGAAVAAFPAYPSRGDNGAGVYYPGICGAVIHSPSAVLFNVSMSVSHSNSSLGLKDQIMY
jgi:hypothetical protein